MHKLVLLLSIIGLSTLLLFGLVWPDNPIVWLASTSTEFAVIRIAMLVAFILLFITAPPRNVLLRKGVGLFALFTGIWTINQTFNNQIKFLDALMLLEFSICAGINVLEKTEQEFLQSISSKKAMLTTSKPKTTAIA